METGNFVSITVEATIRKPAAEVWACFNEPQHVTQWCFASPEWHAPRAESDLRVGGSFTTRMEAKDGSFGFDFGGVYDEVRTNEFLSYTMGDGRKVAVTFLSVDGGTKVTETFDAEAINDVEMQRAGWQAIMDNFKAYCESKNDS